MSDTAIASTFALCLGAPELQAAGILSLFGALDRLGGFFVLTAVRWIGPLVTAVVVAGTAITADLGARKIREELDALQVLGVDPIKNLVVLQPLHRCALAGRPLLGLLRSARGGALRLRLHPLGQGRHRDRRRAGRDANLR